MKGTYRVLPQGYFYVIGEYGKQIYDAKEGFSMYDA
jgi:hypothetical protein